MKNAPPSKFDMKEKTTEPCFAARSNCTGHDSLDQSHTLYDYQLHINFYNLYVTISCRNGSFFIYINIKRDSNDSSYSIQNTVLRCIILHIYN